MARKDSAFEYLREKARKKGYLLSIHFDITYRCPLNCFHCYIDHRKKKELGPQEIEKVLKDALNLNAMFVTYSGGEVFARKDFGDILSGRLGYSIKIISNGYYIGEREVKLLKENNVINVGISMFSKNPATHERITGVRDSFRRTVEAIRLLSENGIRVVVKTSIMKDNYKEYIGLLRWINSLGKNVYAQYDMVITPTMLRREGVRELNIPFEEKKRLYARIKKIEKGREVKVEEMEDSVKQKVAQDSIACYAGITGLYIAPDGRVYPCVEWNELLGDVRKEGIVDIWRNSPRLREIRNLRIRDYKECSGCKYVGVCYICPGLNLRDNYDIFKPSSLACERARMYYEKK